MELLTQAEIITCVEAAAWAPSIHNSQPWAFYAAGDRIEVFADLSRRLPAVDPKGRAMRISLGAAVENLRLAITALGRSTHVQLLPTPGDAQHVATVLLTGRHTPETTDRELAMVIPLRRSNRRPFTDVPPSSAVLARLERVARLNDAVLRFADPMERDALLSLIRTAEVRQHADPACRAELRAWGTDDFYRDDGVPLEAVGSRDENAALPIRDFAPDREMPDRAVERFETEPTIATLTLAGEQTPELWLRAGQALQRVLLEATQLGLATTLFTQPLEQPDLGRLLDDPARHTAVQAILRLGYARFPAPPTPRRPPEDVILSTRPRPRHTAH